MNEKTEWVYFVTLDGDYAAECTTWDKAEEVRLNARGHIAVENRTIWRERTEVEFVFPSAVVSTSKEQNENE